MIKFKINIKTNINLTQLKKVDFLFLFEHSTLKSRDIFLK